MPAVVGLALAPALGAAFGLTTSGAFISAAGLTIAGVNVVGALSTGIFLGAVYGAERLLSSPRAAKAQLQLPAGAVAQEIELAAVSPRFYTYGQDRVGGPVFFQEVGGQFGGWLGYGIVLSCRPIDGVISYLVDDENWAISTGATNEPVESPAGYAPQAVDLGPDVFWPNAGPKFTVFSILVYVPNAGPQPSPTGVGPIMFGEFRNASQAGVVSTLLTRDHASIWDASHLGRGLACLYFRANRMDREYRFVRYPRGFPTVSTIERGHRIYDPRDAGQSFYASGAHLTAALALKAADPAFYTGGDYREDAGGIWSAYNPTWEFSTNPALQIADMLTCPAGFGLSYDDIDWPAFIVAANDCDRLVPVFGGGTGAFAQGHLTWRADEERRDVLGKLLAACDAQLYEDEEGKVSIWVGKWEEPTVALTESDIAMPITFDAASGVYEGDNVVVPAYVEPRSNYQRNTSLQVEDIASISRVGRRATTIDLPAVHDFNQAYRLAARALRRKNAPMKIECVAGPRALLADGERVVRLDLPTYGVFGVFRVMRLEAQSISTIALTLHQVTQDMFEDVVPPFDPINGALPGAPVTAPYTPPAPAAPTLSSSVVSSQAVIAANVPAPGGGDAVSDARFQFRAVDPSTSEPLGDGSFAIFSNFTGQYSAASPGITGVNGTPQRFEVRAWFVNNGQPGPLSASSFITITTFN
jgi:hypothetical protein